MDARVRKAVDRELHKNLGMNPISSEDGVGTITIKLEEYALNPHGVFHGGIIYLICDVCAYFGLLSILDEGLDAVTHDIQVSILRSAKLGDVVEFESKVIRLGKRLAFLETTATSGGEVIATSKITKSIMNF